jgi:hypothetical protein
MNHQEDAPLVCVNIFKIIFVVYHAFGSRDTWTCPTLEPSKYPSRNISDISAQFPAIA